MYVYVNVYKLGCFILEQILKKWINFKVFKWKWLGIIIINFALILVVIEYSILIVYSV